MKFNDDSRFCNTYNAMVSGVDKEELLYLEINFLKLIDFRLMVDPQTFKNYYNHLVEISGKKAVLSSCSCLDPSHSYKIYTHIMKSKGEALRADSKTKDLVPAPERFDKFQSDSQVATKPKTQSKQSSDSVSSQSSKRGNFVDTSYPLE
mmetsp:Transcript_16284/g.18829  ORF Transcript_16284/g.18829 Transcript_16284/m.18829 type:complete len:149 (+) Transcript_16284:333-779(+)|eukprot:CAMPEP_0168339704 /NCGR_PEP_ID=MMETSP0213-20121227/13622_1 /TAXON_ID=151035 /ORGANISM="Euplotes harpa, Strain FSP1.4" /LENGTH=148 /DNA_ID=CAMNT_0008345791 /DNA_START=333 /DNA_END=779 /DNA_ORIENTATION=+